MMKEECRHEHFGIALVLSSMKLILKSYYVSYKYLIYDQTIKRYTEGLQLRQYEE